MEKLVAIQHKPVMLTYT